jgi:hypothetical protein
LRDLRQLSAQRILHARARPAARIGRAWLVRHDWLLLRLLLLVVVPAVVQQDMVGAVAARGQLRRWRPRRQGQGGWRV